MARRLTYGESMSLWERQTDERDWKVSLREALDSENSELIKQLVAEGIMEGYSFTPFLRDPRVTQLLK